MVSLAQRLLDFADPGPSPEAGGGQAVSEPGWRSNLRWFEVFLLAHMGARSFLNFPRSGSQIDELLYAASIGAALIGLAAPLRRKAVRVGFVLVTCQLLRSLPDSANHVFLESMIFGLFALLDPGDDDESRLLMQAMRWYIAIFFFYAGVQKFVYGYYFDGQFLAYMAATEDRFGLVFQHLLPAAELDRLRAFNEVQLADYRYQVSLDAGPYRVDAPLFVWASNFVWIYEMAAALLLMVRKTRAATALTLIGFVLLIEAGARELTFGFLMINLAFLFLEGPWIRKLLPLFALLYGYLLLAEGGGAGILPMFWYSPA